MDPAPGGNSSCTSPVLIGVPGRSGRVAPSAKSGPGTPPGFGASSAGGLGASRTGGLKGSIGSSNVTGNSGTSGLLGISGTLGISGLIGISGMLGISGVLKRGPDRPFALRRAAASRSGSAILCKKRNIHPSC